jgi:hypothetical protein
MQQPGGADIVESLIGYGLARNSKRYAAEQIEVERVRYGRRFRSVKQNEGFGRSLTLCLIGRVGSFADNDRNASRKQSLFQHDEHLAYQRR